MPYRDQPAERLTGLFLLGIVLFSPLALRIFDIGADRGVAGVPALVLYAFAAWGLLITLVAIVARTLDRSPPSPPGESEARPSSQPDE